MDCPEQLKTPICDMLERHSEAARARLHMPGHKGVCAAFDPAWDVTELADTDNLFMPSGAIKAAMGLAAKGFGAGYTQFLTCGATSGLLALLLSLDKGRVIVARDCHRSVAAGVGLSGLTPAFVWPKLRADNMPGVVSQDDVRDELAFGDAVAVVVTCPNYYGCCADLLAIARVAHERGALLIVDGAHGTHFAAGPPLPPYAGEFSDAWVDSAHKTLSALGQGAYLHLGKRAIAAGMTPERVVANLALVHTSSPSYPIMASLDSARARLLTRANEWRELCLSVDELRGRITALGGYACPTPEPGDAIAHTDPTRLVIDVTRRGYTGYEAELRLAKSGVFVEMADASRIVALSAPWDIAALTELEAALAALEPREPIAHGKALSIPRAPYEGLGESTVSIPLGASKGRTCASVTGCYPPGVPALWPGERITPEALDYLLEMQAMGATLFGLSGGNISVYK